MGGLTTFTLYETETRSTGIWARIEAIVAEGDVSSTLLIDDVQLYAITTKMIYAPPSKYQLVVIQ